ncbi:esterase-like activity of phytase family protein [Prochlorothrix hollandica]
MAGTDRYLGTLNDDLLLAEDDFPAANSVVLGLGGDDELDAVPLVDSGGNNTLGGGSGADVLVGFQADRLLGDTDNDELESDSFSGEPSRNLLWGGAGDDTLRPYRNDTVQGGAGQDHLYPGQGNNWLVGGRGDDVFWLGDGSSPPAAGNTIADFDPAVDSLHVSLAGVSSLSDLVLTQGSDGVTLTLANGGATLATLLHTTASDLVLGVTLFIAEPEGRNPGALGSPTSPAPIRSVTAMHYLGQDFLDDNGQDGTTVGGLSGLTYDPASGDYYALSEDGGTVDAARFYRFSLDLSDGSLADGDGAIAAVTLLSDLEGVLLPTGSLNPKAMALTDNGSVYIASEQDGNGIPWIREFSLSGQQLAELALPAAFLDDGSGQTGVRPNLALESLALSPTGQFLYTATEEALIQDGDRASTETGSAVRLVQYDLTGATPTTVAQFVYVTDAIPAAATATTADSNGLVELLALSDQGLLLALERSVTATGVGAKVYQVQLDGATDVSAVFSLVGFSGTTATKTLVLDLATLGIDLETLEGMTLGQPLANGNPTLILVSNDYFDAGVAQNNQILAFELEINRNPGFESVSRVFSVPENSHQGTAIATVTATDPDGTTGLIYSLSAGNLDPDSDGNPAFAVNASSGALTVNDPDDLDFETSPSYGLTLTVTDPGGLTASTPVTVQITDVNEAPNFAAATGSVSLREHSSGGTLIQSLNATDPDGGDSLRFSITAGNGDRDGDGAVAFALDASTGALTVNDPDDLDFETANSLALTLVVTDLANLSDSLLLTVNLTNINEAPVLDGGDRSFSLRHDSSPGTAIATFAATDPDADDRLTYGLASGNFDGDGDGTAAFAVNPNTGELALTDPDDLDFGTDTSYELTLMVQDLEELADSLALTLTTLAVAPPSSRQDFQIREHLRRGTAIGQIQGQGSLPAGALTYGLVSNFDGDGDGQNAFSLSPGGLLTVNDGGDLDFEQQSVFSFAIEIAGDQGFRQTVFTTVTLEDRQDFGFDTSEGTPPGLFSLVEDTTLQLSVTAHSTPYTSEVVLFLVDDSQGRVNGLMDSDPGYLAALLQDPDRLQVALSVLASDNPSGLPSDFSLGEFSRLLSLAGGARLGFMVVQDGTLDELRQGVGRSVFFSQAGGMQVSEFSSTGVSLDFDDNGDGGFGNFRLNLQALQGQNSAIGLNRPRFTPASGLDLLQLDQDRLGTVTVYSEASFDNMVSFFMTNDRGDVVTAEGQVIAAAGSTDYIDALVNQGRLLGITLTADTSSASFLFKGGVTLAPFIIANGTYDNYQTSQVYTPFIGTNADGADHIRRLGDTAFGFEDQASGGDRDFDDLIINIKLAS